MMDHFHSVRPRRVRKQSEREAGELSPDFESDSLAARNTGARASALQSHTCFRERITLEAACPALSRQRRRAGQRPAPLSGYLRNNPASPASSAAVWVGVAQGLLGQAGEGLF